MQRTRRGLHPCSRGVVSQTPRRRRSTATRQFQPENLGSVDRVAIHCVRYTARQATGLLPCTSVANERMSHVHCLSVLVLCLLVLLGVKTLGAFTCDFWCHITFVSFVCMHGRGEYVGGVTGDRMKILQTIVSSTGQ